MNQGEKHMEHENRPRKRQLVPYFETEEYWREIEEEQAEQRRMEERAGIYPGAD